MATPEEIDAMWERAIAGDEKRAKEFEEEFAKLSKEEQEELMWEVENTRFWEDDTGDVPIMVPVDKK